MIFVNKILQISSPVLADSCGHRHVPQARKGQEDDLRYRGSNDKVSDIRHQVYANDGFLFLRSDVGALLSNVVLLILSAKLVHD